MIRSPWEFSFVTGKYDIEVELEKWRKFFPKDEIDVICSDIKDFTCCNLNSSQISIINRYIIGLHSVLIKFNIEESYERHVGV